MSQGTVEIEWSYDNEHWTSKFVLDRSLVIKNTRDGTWFDPASGRYYRRASK